MATEYRTSAVSCPRCKTRGQVHVVDSLDLSVASDITRKLARSGKLFIFECPECGKREPVSYPMSCIDDDGKAFITVLDLDDRVESYRNTCRIYKELEHDTGYDDEERYTFRIVDTCQELSEKLRIFSDYLDDRVVEILKVFVCEDIAGSAEKIYDVRCVYQTLRSGKMVFFAAYDGEQYDVEVPMGNYLPIEERLEYLRGDKLEKAYIINQQWADRALGLITEKEGGIEYY